MELNNFKFNKKFGQNFIFDKNLLAAIVSDSRVTKQDDVLEIGPGAGTLTNMIAQNCKKVVSYEIDENLKDILANNLAGVTNSTIVFKDALKTDILEIEQNFDGEYSIIANLPYYITTPLIFKFLEETEKVKTITIMVQKEVAQRLVAKNNSKDYGITTVLLDFYGVAKITRFVGRKMFTPMPNVDSAVVRIDLVKNKYNCNKQLFTKVVQASFSMRRKTMLNNISSSLGLSKDVATKILENANISVTARAEQLSTLDYVNLTVEYAKVI
ncbi:MAG: ribosomal RNA small subunit methyltransferase A [Clostridia bacterium]|nr:ribosomal RNA small subunit methyltransferase A [Clostridia bacterium]